jgi:uncharacterized ubiquitin-like protein YukD
MTSVEIAARTKRLVFIVTPDIGIDPRRETLGMAQIGAGVLLMANDSGFLVGTNRHVIDPSGAFHFSAKDGEAMVISNAWEYARARVIARHQDLDLALLWVLRRGGSDRFRQPITPYGSIPVGDPVFVVGHPQRLFFTLSNGLISRVDGDALQLSAPISPGNSGGPVYDSYGNLLGIVTSKLDREITPNAENLNFATRADAFLDEAGWKFLDHGQERLRQFSRREGDSLDMANINVTVYDSTENKRVPVELPDDAPANKIIAVLIDKLRLPKNGPDAAPLSYKFHHKNSGRQIQDAQTLSAAGVQDGDILRLQPEITAGRMH